MPAIAFLLSFLSFSPLIASLPLVNLSSGTFRGLAVNGTDRWLGIPYAQPPLGSLRFEAPVPISRPVEGIQDALNFSHACPQPLPPALVSEDCLYLNVCL
jgi:carboxylesterase type B